jgi:hypothetical protein
LAPARPTVTEKGMAPSEKNCTLKVAPEPPEPAATAPPPPPPPASSSETMQPPGGAR